MPTPKSKLLGALGRGTLIVLAVNSAGLFVTLGVQVLFARLLGPGELGEYSLVLSWLTLAVLFTVGGADSIVLREVSGSQAKGENDRILRVLSWASRAVLKGSVLTAGAVALYALLFAKQLCAPFLWGAVLIPLWAMTNLRQSLCRGYQMMVGSKLPEMILRPLLHALILLGALWTVNRMPTSGMVTATHAASAAIALLIGWYFFRPPLPSRDHFSNSPTVWDESNRWNSERKKLTAIVVMMVMWSEIDKILLGFFTSFEVVGVYAVAARLAGLSQFGMDTVGNIAAPLISEHVAGKSKEDLARLLGRVTVLTIATSVPIAFVLIVGGPFILPVFGEKFVAAYIPLCILSAGNACAAMYGLPGYTLIMGGKDLVLLRLMARGVIVLILLVAGGAVLFGTIGAAAGAAIGNVVRAWSMHKEAQRELEIRLSLRAAFNSFSGWR